MKYLMLSIVIFTGLSSCKAQTLPIGYDTEKPSEAQINYTKNKADKEKHYIIFRNSFGSEIVKVYDGKELIDEGELKPIDLSFGVHHIAIIDRKTQKVKIVFDNDTYYLNLEKEYQYIFMDNFDGKVEVLFSKYIKFDF